MLEVLDVQKIRIALPVFGDPKIIMAPRILASSAARSAVTLAVHWEKNPVTPTNLDPTVFKPPSLLVLAVAAPVLPTHRRVAVPSGLCARGDRDILGIGCRHTGQTNKKPFKRDTHREVT